MLEYQELLDILKGENIDSGDYSLSRMREYYGAGMPKQKLLPIIESMILATLDYSTPLDEVLSIVRDYECEEKIDESDSHLYDIFDTVVSNLKLNAQNAERLLDVLEEADSLSAYTAILTTFSSFYPAETLDKVRDKAKKIFDPMLLPL